MSSTDLKSFGWRILPWCGNIITAFLIYWAATLAGEVRDLRIDMDSLKTWRAGIEQTQWTSKDQAKYATDSSKDIQSIWMKLAEIQQGTLVALGEIKVTLAQVPKKDDEPPQWFRDYVKGIDDRVRVVEMKTAGQK